MSIDLPETLNVVCEICAISFIELSILVVVVESPQLVKKIQENVNKKINGIVKSPSLAPPAPPPPAEPKLEDFYPSETFQGGYEKYEYT